MAGPAPAPEGARGRRAGRRLPAAAAGGGRRRRPAARGRPPRPPGGRLTRGRPGAGPQRPAGGRLTRTRPGTVPQRPAAWQGAGVLYSFVYSRVAVLVRHWFEIGLSDGVLEHGARLELRLLDPQPHRGTEAAAARVGSARPR